MKNAFCVAKQATTEEKKRRCGILRIKYIIWFGHIASPLLTVLTQGIFTLRSHCRCGPCAECVTFFPSNIFEAQTKFGLFGHFNFGGFCFFLSFLHRIWSLRALYWLTWEHLSVGIFFLFFHRKMMPAILWPKSIRKMMALINQFRHSNQSKSYTSSRESQTLEEENTQRRTKEKKKTKIKNLRYFGRKTMWRHNRRQKPETKNNWSRFTSP